MEMFEQAHDFGRNVVGEVTKDGCIHPSITQAG